MNRKRWNLLPPAPDQLLSGVSGFSPLMAQLAYNLLTWVHRDTTARSPKLSAFGKLRLVRDVFHILGRIQLDKQGRILEITLNDAHPYATAFLDAAGPLLNRNGLSLNLGQI